MKTLPIGPFRGINNRLPDFSMATEEGYWLREADNVEIDNAGRVRRRAASVLVQAMTGAHSLYMLTETTGYVVRGAAIYSITLPTYAETLVKVLTSDALVSWLPYSGSLYYSNGVDSGRIAGGTFYPWALPTPAAPSVTPIAGALFAGQYKVAVSYANATTGEEGGISPATNHVLATDGALRIVLPGAAAGATHVNVYVSTVNGANPFLQTTVVAATASVDITAMVVGRDAVERYEAPLPPGSILFLFNGQLCSVSGADVFYGIPYRPGYYLPAEGVIPFPEAVSVAVPNQGGVYVAADKTYFLAGAQLGADLVVRDALPYGAVPGTAFVVPNKLTVGWFGKNGIVLADTQGVAQAVASDAVDFVVPQSGVSTVIETRGYRRVLSCGWCINLESLAASTYSANEFTSINGAYGTKADGIYALEGIGKVDAHISLGKNDFGTDNTKRLPAVYLGCTSDEPLELRVTTPDDEDFRYEARSCGTSVRNHRVDPGKGLLANWYDLSIYNIDGSDFTLASVSFAPVASGRRI